MDELELLADIKRRAQIAGGVSKWARILRMDRSNLHKVITGKQRPGPIMLQRLGYWSEIRYGRGLKHPEHRTLADALAEPKPHKLSLIPRDYQLPDPPTQQPQRDTQSLTPNSRSGRGKRMF